MFSHWMIFRRMFRAGEGGVISPASIRASIQTLSNKYIS